MAADGVADPSQAISGLQRQLDELAAELRERTAERDEALAQQAATAEVLQVISSASGALAPVFDAILERAMTLCGAAFGFLTTFDGERFKPAAMRGVPEALAAYFTAGMDQPRPGESHARILPGEDVIHTLDQMAEEPYRSGTPLRRAVVDLGGARTALVVALRKDSVVLGALTIYRKEVRPFSDRQIALMRSFAAQAVIAIENVRLLTEQQAALARQTATAEVLGIISSSPGRLEPVFEAMLANAIRICSGAFGMLAMVDGAGFRGVATHGVGAEFTAALSRIHQPPPGTGLDVMRKTSGTVQVSDCLAEPAYDRVRALNPAFARVRTALHVPMLKETALLGAILIYRDQMVPFADDEIALVENFAKQAVVAVENTRLLNELRDRTRDLQESLDYQAATSGVLEVISRSPDQLQPVVDAIAHSARRLCDAQACNVFRFDGKLLHLVASDGFSPEAVSLARSQYPAPPGRESAASRSITSGSVVEIPDVREDADYRLTDVAAAGNYRSILAVPMLKDGRPVGAIAVARPPAGAFPSRQLQLLKTFADQAVIAIENVRLFDEIQARSRELAEALEYQTATSEVLKVISRSSSDIQPVLDALVQSAARLCQADFAVIRRRDGDTYPVAASAGLSPEQHDQFTRYATVPDRGTIFGRAIIEGRTIHIPDVLADPEFSRPQVQQVVTVRAGVGVPLIRDGSVIGVISVMRSQPGSFRQRQIDLVANFADQAVIAMENARLLAEQEAALERQTATAEILQVINSSREDLTPVFHIILEKAHALCGTAQGSLQLYDGERFRAVALRNLPQPFADLLRQGVDAGSAGGQLLDGAGFIHVHDMAEIDEPLARSAVELGGVRTLLRVALRKDGALLGQIVAARREVRPFADKEIALLTSFADQAVIAMENARLMAETRESLERQTATADILRVINSSREDLTPVFDMILEKAHALCGTDKGSLHLYDGETFRAVASRNLPEPLADLLRQGVAPGHAGQSLLDGAGSVHLRDTAEIDDRTARRVVELGGIRTALHVALRRDGVLLGRIIAARTEVRPFADKEIALLASFADQAVIAIENARLLAEQQAALERQTATADILRVINSSREDLTPVFGTILEKAHTVCSTTQGSLQLYDGESFRAVASRNLPQPFADLLRQGVDPGSMGRQLLDGAGFVHVRDVAEIDDPWAGRIAAFGVRTALQVALRKDGVLLGRIVASRNEVRPFADKEIALLTSFADQAVIAMENARLMAETRESLERQTATADILRIINSSREDLTPVFDAILEKAHTLCGAARGSLHLYDGEKFHPVALRNLPEPLADLVKQGVTPSPASRPLLEGAAFVHVRDQTEIDDPWMRRIVELGGARTALHVALRKDGVLLGRIVASRAEVRPFADKEIALLTSFADQAVIAMENARLLTEIRQRQQELRVTFDNMGDGVAMFDSDLRLAAWNRNFQQILDLPDAIPAQRPLYADYLRMLAERGEFGSDDIEAELNRRLEDARRELRFEHTRPDGRVIEVRRSAVPGGGFVLIYSDVTERKRAEQEVRAARDAAEAALRELQTTQANLVHAQKMAALGQLTAGIAHEIKNPLNFVNNFAGLSIELLDELKASAAPAIAQLGDDARGEIDETLGMLTGNLGKIVEHGRRADGIVRSMLQHSRGGSGDWQSVDLNGVVDEALNLAYHGARSQDQSFNITMERDFDRGLAPIEVVPQDVTRVFLNLIGNGFYAAAKRQRQTGSPFRPVLKVTTRDLGEEVEIRVRDNGVGIAPEHRDRLFQPFFTTKPTGEGTGLGLSISYDIVTQQHSGSITVDSEPGTFTEFAVRLPRRRHAGTAGRMA